MLRECDVFRDGAILLRKWVSCAVFCVEHPASSFNNPSQYDIKIDELHVLSWTWGIRTMIFFIEDMTWNCANYRMQINSFNSLTLLS